MFYNILLCQYEVNKQMIPLSEDHVENDVQECKMHISHRANNSYMFLVYNYTDASKYVMLLATYHYTI